MIDYQAEALLDYLPPLARIAVHKDILREAGRLTREKMLHEPCRGAAAQAWLFASLTRALVAQDLPLTIRLQAHHPEARDHLVVAGSVVTLVQPAAFAVAAEKAQKDACSEKRAELERERSNQDGRKGRGNALAAVSRKALLWRRGCRRVVLAGVHDEVDGSVHKGAKVWNALAAHWGPIFAAKPPDERAIDDFLSTCTASPLAADLRFPSIDNIEKTIGKLAHSAPGPDGIPYGAWKMAGTSGATSIWSLLCWCASGGMLPMSMTCSLMVFLPKDVACDEGCELTRNASSTRPLGLKNTDLKIIGAALSWSVGPVIRAEAHAAQRGFIGGRDFVQNIVELDGLSRLYDMECHP